MESQETQAHQDFQDQSPEVPQNEVEVTQEVSHPLEHLVVLLLLHHFDSNLQQGDI